MKANPPLDFAGWATVFLMAIPLFATTIWFASLLDKRIALLEQNATQVTHQISDLKEQLLRIGDNSEKIYRLLAKKGLVSE